MNVRRPAVAGLFYDADPDALRRSIQRAFDDAVPAPDGVAPPKAIVAPHAGYVYSGAIAASAFGCVAPLRDRIRRVVLLGPSHRVYLRGLAVPSSDSFATPLGDVQIDVGLRATALALGGVVEDDEPHRHEHSLEVELPLLQTVLDDFTLLPIAVGDADPDLVATALDAVWGGTETLVVVSTDLSHYHRYDEAVRRDARTASAIVAADPDAIADRDACGARPLRGLLTVVRRRGLGVRRLDLRNSGDTAGDRDRVVGYGAFTVG